MIDLRAIRITRITANSHETFANKHVINKIQVCFKDDTPTYISYTYIPPPPRPVAGGAGV